MNADEVIEDARRWADRHRDNAYQREGVKRVDALLALAEEQDMAFAYADSLHQQVMDGLETAEAERDQQAAALARCTCGGRKND